MTDRRPWHLGAFLGLSIGAYAGILAAVTGVQSAADAAVVAARGPGLADAAALAADHDRLERALGVAGDAYGDAAARYEGFAARLAALDARVGDLAAIVAEVEGSASSLPARVSLPSVARSVAPASVPTVHATTGASGG
jgi:hypothetical protein